MREAVIVAAVRTPLAKNGKTLAPVRAEQLGAIVVREAVKRAKIDPKKIDEVIFSCITGMEIKNPARVVSLAAGIPVEVPAFSVDRGCGSSLTGIAIGANMIQNGSADVIVVGGVESCSNRPYLMERIKSPFQYDPPNWCEQILSPPEFKNLSNGMTSERVAERFNITREECDAYAVESHKKAALAWDEGRFNEHIVPVEMPQRKGPPVIFSRDEIIRPDCSMEELSKLPGAFKKDGVSTAGNSSPLTDGAACVVLMEKNLALSVGAEILANYKSFASAGLEPQIMGMGPVYAVRKLMNQTGLTLDDIDLIELNEAFASQVVACIRELKIDKSKLNVNGGAIAIGHPFGASGAILTARLVYEMKRRNARRGLITFCVGGGLGVAMLVER